MRRTLIAACAATLLAPMPFLPSAWATEGCVVTNPGPAAGQPVGAVTCTYVAAQVGDLGGSGTWRITVTTPKKKGQKKPTVRVYKSTSPAPTVTMAVIKPGESVKAEALAPGSVAAVGNLAP